MRTERTIARNLPKAKKFPRRVSDGGIWWSGGLVSLSSVVLERALFQESGVILAHLPTVLPDPPLELGVVPLAAHFFASFAAFQPSLNPLYAVRRRATGIPSTRDARS